MNKQPTRKVKSADRIRIEKAKKQIIQCECIIRKVLAIHNCFEELRNLDRECMVHYVFVTYRSKTTRKWS